jgi:hypothetical protein
MLDCLVVVDYIEGAGGEYISSVINSHPGFSNNVVLQKWFNSQQHIIHDWDNHIAEQADLFLIQCQEHQIKNLAISYHLCMHPTHVDIMQQLSKGTRFVKIDSVNHNAMVRMDHARKILFNQITKKQVKELKYRIGNSRPSELIKLFLEDRLYGIDLVLYKRNLPITRANREMVIELIMGKQETCPTNDITILYNDFFVSFDNMKEKYYNLCNSLNIQPNIDILNAMLIRNRKNLEEVTEFTKNFNAIKDRVFSTTP